MFWRPVAALLPKDHRKHLLSWPGLGDEPHDPNIRGVDDLVAMVLDHIRGPTDLVAQSMGGLVALRVALAAPEKVRRLVLTATSGGVPVADLGGTDWRADYCREYPRAASWITKTHEDLSPRLSSITAPCLLLWGDVDPISPPAVGRRLQARIPNATFHIVVGGNHDLARTHAAQIAPLIAAHLR